MGTRYDDTDWFRSSTWSPEIAESFEARLKRARSHNRQQYVRIQGVHLAAQDDPQCRDAGRELLRRAAYDFGEFTAENLAALEQLGDALLKVGYDVEAESTLREVVMWVEKLPTGRSFTSGITELTIAELLFKRGDLNSLSDADELLDRIEPHVREKFAMWRNAFLRFLDCRARVGAARGRTEAGQYAREALEVAAETHPSIPRHPDLGRPNASHSQRADLEAIAARFL